MADTHQQLAASEAELARAHGDQSSGAFRMGPNPVFVQVQEDRAKAAADLQAAKARAASDQAQLASVTASLVEINDYEQHLTDLERTRSTLDDNYRAAVKIRDDRRISEGVQSGREANVRVLQEPVAPLLPRGTRMLILIAGAILSVIGAAVTGLASHALRRVYLIPEALEMETGLRVLCSVPQRKELAGSNLAIRPS